MPRFTLVLTGLVSLILGMLMSVSQAAAEDPPPAPVARLLVSQRVELLPQEPLCWRIVEATRPAGTRRPPSGYVADPLSLFYLAAGEAQIEYAGGPTVQVKAGQGAFIGANNWFAWSIGGTARERNIVFALSCQTFPPGVPNVTQLGNTGPLPGVRPDKGPHIIDFREVRWAVGAQIPPSITGGPRSFLILEGEFAFGMPEGLRRLGPGETITVPAGTPYQTTNVGAVPALLLNVQITPVGEVTARIPASDVRLINPLAAAAPAALPRAGDHLSWLSSLAMLMGAVLMAAGINLRRRA